MKKEYLAVGYIPGEGFQVCPIHLVENVSGFKVKLDSKRRRWRPEAEEARYVPLGSPQASNFISPILTVFDPTDWSSMERLFDFIHAWRPPDSFETQDQARRRIQRGRISAL